MLEGGGTRPLVPPLDPPLVCAESIIEKSMSKIEEKQNQETKTLKIAISHSINSLSYTNTPSWSIAFRYHYTLEWVKRGHLTTRSGHKTLPLLVVIHLFTLPKK
jgi:hypothetical protein